MGRKLCDFQQFTKYFHVNFRSTFNFLSTLLADEWLFLKDEWRENRVKSKVSATDKIIYWVNWERQGRQGQQRDLGSRKSPCNLCCPCCPCCLLIINLCALRSLLLRQNFVMPRLCYGSAEQIYLLCSHLNRKVHLSLFSFHFFLLSLSDNARYAHTHTNKYK